MLMSVCLHEKWGLVGGGRHVRERGRGWGEAWGVSRCCEESRGDDGDAFYCVNGLSTGCLDACRCALGCLIWFVYGFETFVPSPCLLEKVLSRVRSTRVAIVDQTAVKAIAAFRGERGDPLLFLLF